MVFFKGFSCLFYSNYTAYISFREKQVSYGYHGISCLDHFIYMVLAPCNSMSMQAISSAVIPLFSLVFLQIYHFYNLLFSIHYTHFYSLYIFLISLLMRPIIVLNIATESLKYCSSMIASLSRSHSLYSLVLSIYT